jgi:hypothetical protein
MHERSQRTQDKKHKTHKKRKRHKERRHSGSPEPRDSGRARGVDNDGNERSPVRSPSELERLRREAQRAKASSAPRDEQAIDVVSD